MSISPPQHALQDVLVLLRWVDGTCAESEARQQQGRPGKRCKAWLAACQQGRQIQLPEACVGGDMQQGASAILSMHMNGFM